MMSNLELSPENCLLVPSAGRRSSLELIPEIISDVSVYLVRLEDPELCRLRKIESHDIGL